MKCRVKFFKPKINPHVIFFPEPLVNIVLKRSSKCDKKFCVFCWEKVANKVAIFCHITMFLALANTSFLSPTLTSNRQKWATSFLLFFWWDERYCEKVLSLHAEIQYGWSWNIFPKYSFQFWSQFSFNLMQNWQNIMESISSWWLSKLCTAPNCF